MALIASVSARSIKDSRGKATVEVTVTDDQGRIATASLPLGSSVGKYEGVNVSAEQAIKTINNTIAPQLLRFSLDTQKSIDDRLLEFDKSATREKIGVNSTLGISLACARLIAQSQSLPLYHYIQTISDSPGFSLPTPMFNLINGGKHATNNLDFQEYMIIPLGIKTFHEKLAAGRQVLGALGKILTDHGHDTKMGFEGGYAPNLSTNEEGMGYLVEAIKAAGYIPGEDILLGSDIAASALKPTFAPTVETYISLFENFPLYSLEDPFGEDEWEKWAELKIELDKLNAASSPRLLVGDDLFMANKERIETGIKKFVANSILIKTNQAATLSETIECINLARKYNYVHIISHRSGETLDSFISDLAVGTASAFIKAGSPNDRAPERIVKYERIAEIEEELNVAASS